MYLAYQDILTSMADAMKWKGHKLMVGEDLSYGNMVACASAKWTTAHDPSNPTIPPMTTEERNGIVQECFFDRKHFLRQLFQSLPSVILIFSQTTANAFISSFQKSFAEGSPRPGESLDELMKRKVRLELGKDSKGKPIVSRVIFAPHITGNPQEFKEAKQHLISQLIEEANEGSFTFNSKTGHLRRSRGSCVFCPMLGIGPCDYEAEIRSLVTEEKIFPSFSASKWLPDKEHVQQLVTMHQQLQFVPSQWDNGDGVLTHGNRNLK